ncbi:PREDICTED: antho-RFamide neuropeptides-like isoform X2 [Branchiostoma belcheri]|uniref:Antho-RFamide neuropeptides-like isoform X2 n=1 Tax=Branchiostoma belcheri TaxID=7741 RepID=A0A6P4ZCS2_BRABE|nr:PREDICTED: antho-RFamide neuropeptides-like isoform X2 [Branchiostoma belcheri]
MELRLFVTAFLLVLVAFHVCAEDEKKEVEREVEKRMDAGWMGKRFDASAFGKRLLDRGGKRQDELGWLGKRFDASAFGKRQDKRQDELGWLGKRMSDPSAFGKRLLDRGGKRMDAGWMGKRDDPRTSCRTQYDPTTGRWKYVCP